MDLGRLYRERTAELQDIKTCHELSALLADDEKSFYFYLMDSYYSDRDLSFIRKDITNDVAIAISLFCMVCRERKDEDNAKVYEYLKKYVYVDESPIQAGKVLAEQTMARARSKFLKDNNLELKNGELIKKE